MEIENIFYGKKAYDSYMNGNGDYSIKNSDKYLNNLKDYLLNCNFENIEDFITKEMIFFNPSYNDNSPVIFISFFLNKIKDENSFSLTFECFKIMTINSFNFNQTYYQNFRTINIKKQIDDNINFITQFKNLLKNISFHSFKLNINTSNIDTSLNTIYNKDESQNIPTYIGATLNTDFERNCKKCNKVCDENYIQIGNLSSMNEKDYCLNCFKNIIINKLLGFQFDNNLSNINNLILQSPIALNQNFFNYFDNLSLNLDINDNDIYDSDVVYDSSNEEDNDENNINTDRETYITLSRDKLKNETYDCPICYETIKKDEIILLTCDHYYCKNCLIKIKNCGLCRAKIHK